MWLIPQGRKMRIFLVAYNSVALLAFLFGWSMTKIVSLPVIILYATAAIMFRSVQDFFEMFFFLFFVGIILLMATFVVIAIVDEIREKLNGRRHRDTKRAPCRS